MEPLYCGHIGDLEKCPMRGVLISGIDLQDTEVHVLIPGVSFKRGSTVLLI